jgi:hypothetical protein
MKLECVTCSKMTTALLANVLQEGCGISTSKIQARVFVLHLECSGLCQRCFATYRFVSMNLRLVCKYEHNFLRNGMV